VYFVQPVPDRWNVVIAEVRHEEQIFASSPRERLDAHNRDVRDIKLLVVSFRYSYRNSWS
jgi:hypothetical protein